MRFKDENILGLVAWGTKRGKKVFFSDNIADETEAIDNALYDIHSAVQFFGVNLTFYSFERNAEYESFTIYRTIYDWANRLGYYAVSVFLPAGKIVATENIPGLLKSLSASYWEKYIAPNPVSNRIREDVKEDPRSFVAEITDIKYKLSPLQTTNTVFGVQKCVLKFIDEVDLKSIFEDRRREELTKYGQVFVLPAGQQGLICNFEVLTLPPVERKIRLIIKTYGYISENESKLLLDTKLIVHKNKDLIFNDKVHGGSYEVPGLLLRDKLQVIAEKDGYNREVIKESTVKDIVSLLFDKDSKSPELPIKLKQEEDKKGNKPSQSDRYEFIQGQDYRDRSESPKGFHTEVAADSDSQSARTDEKKAVDIEPILPPQLPAEISPLPPKADGKQGSQSHGFKKWLDSNFTMIAGTVGTIVFLSLVFGIVLFFTGSNKAQDFDYTRLNSETDIFKTQVDYKSQRQWDANRYDTDIKLLRKKQKEIDSLSRIESINADSLNYSRKLLNDIETSCKARIVSDRDSFLKGVDFDSVKTNLFIKACLDLGLDKSWDTVYLMQFKKICYWVNRSNEVINGVNNDIQARGKIKYELNFILTGAKYVFLSEEQRNVIRNYRKTLEMMGSKKYANADAFLKGIANEYSSGERQDISDFLKTRKNK